MDKELLAVANMLDAVVCGASEEFVRVPYGASHEDVAAINEWHQMAKEARAALSDYKRSLPVTSDYWKCEDLTIMESERIAYRAGMRRAARILREIAADGIPNDSFTISANVLAADIECAAGGEG